MNERMLTVTEVSKIFGVAKKTVYRWIWSGKIGFVRLGGCGIRISPEHLRKFAPGVELDGGKGSGHNTPE